MIDKDYTDYLQDILDSIIDIDNFISGMRDKLIHDYFGVDLEIVWQAANSDIPPLKQDIKRIINDQG